MSEIIYEIEGGLDFFKELKQMKSAENDTVNTQVEPVDRCQITDEKLRKDHITLKCGHKFNYVPLFKDVIFQKCSLLPKNVSSSIVTTYTKNTASVASAATQSNITVVSYNSSYNLETNKVQYNEIKCPYCRSITPHILPYYPYPDVNKIKYVNSPPDLALPTLSCEFHQHKEPTTDNICRTGCIYYEKYDRMLCSKHFNKLETEEQQKQQQPPPTRRKSKTIATAIATAIANDENVIISHHNLASSSSSSSSSCLFVLLSGQRKGCLCGKPIWRPKTTTTTTVDNGAYCKAHYSRVDKKDEPVTLTSS
jgi:hypothetical protein